MRRRALLVEDEALGGMLLRQMLIDLGWEVDGPAISLSEGLQKAAGGDHVVALLDVNLGGEMCFPIAETLEARGVPYIFTTGYGEQGLELAGRSAPVLSKPFTTDMLAGALNRVLAAEG